LTLNGNAEKSQLIITKTNPIKAQHNILVALINRQSRNVCIEALIFLPQNPFAIPANNARDK
jgi:hypothetical protein